MQNQIKRTIDITAAVFGIVFLLPLFLIIPIIIRKDSPGDAIFKQERVGKNGKKFNIYKFRTMSVLQNSDSLKITAQNDKRITKIGLFLRQYKIDELPQLFNVLCGDMSLVGPRPEVEKYVNYYSEYDKKTILSTRPGITDIASLKFRNESEILAKFTDTEQAYINKILPKKLRYCRFYVKNQSVCLDLKIILMTLKAIFN